MRLPLAAAVLLSACFHPQVPYRFLAGLGPSEPTEALALAFSQAGQPPATVEPSRRRVESAWQVTSYPLSTLDGQNTVLVTRYVGTWAPAEAGRPDVTVVLELLHCAQATVAVRPDGRDVDGRCEVVEGGIPEAFQAGVNELGARVRDAMPR